jgi:hypothetical protein
MPHWHSGSRTPAVPARLLRLSHVGLGLDQGAHAHERHLENIELHLLDTGHFALETHAAEIAAYIDVFNSPHARGLKVSCAHRVFSAGAALRPQRPLQHPDLRCRLGDQRMTDFER